ncbi:MAG TPA: type III-A CRISPR-associated RAMP protein Csm5, partial [bacterium]|nr:type III-A CRISPR-associated RAMP protein Csm5 [bacterium]
MHMTLETLSPLHIGGGAGVLKSFEFLVQKDRMIAVSEDRLVRALAAENLLEDYIATIDKGLQRFRLGDYLRNRGFDQPNLLSNITRYSCRIADVNGVQDIRPFIRDAFQRPFIPGTAIKGVLRTAIFYCAIKRMSEDRKKRFLDDPIRRSLENFKQKNDTRRGTKEWTKKNLFSRQENEFFQNFKTSKDTKKSDPKTDLLRVLRVSDSKPLERDCAEVRQAKI